MILCLTPSPSNADIQSGYISLSVTSKHNEYVEVPYLLEYNMGATLSHIHPATGPSTGGTWITVFGSGFEATDELLCWFGEYATVANFISES